MGRSVKYEFIVEERVRRQTFRKRKAGLLKKVSELKTLCCVDACAVIYSTKTGSGAQPDVWPSSFEAYRLLQRFKSLPIVKQATNMMNHDKFLRQNILRLSKNFDKEKKKNRWVEMEQLMTKILAENNLHDVSNLEDLKDVAYLLDGKINLVNDRIENVTRDENEIRRGLWCGKEKQ